MNNDLNIHEKHYLNLHLMILFYISTNININKKFTYIHKIILIDNSQKKIIYPNTWSSKKFISHYKNNSWIMGNIQILPC